MSKFVAFLFLIFISSVSLAQQGVSIRHYQRNWATDSIHIPCEKWDTKDLLINVPDSLYDSGSITVKKLKYKGVKGFGYSVEIKDGRTSKVVISCKGKKQIEMLLSLDSYLFDVYGNDKNCTLISFMSEHKRRGELVIALK